MMIPSTNAQESLDSVKRGLGIHPDQLAIRNIENWSYDDELDSVEVVVPSGWILEPAALEDQVEVSELLVAHGYQVGAIQCWKDEFEEADQIWDYDEFLPGEELNFEEEYAGHPMTRKAARLEEIVQRFRDEVGVPT
jgi:hypothetical protein